MKLTMETGIYQIKNKITNQIYIGSSNDIRRRWYEHIAKKSIKLRIDREMKEQGIENFELTIVCLCSIKQLREKELYYISKLKPFYNDKVMGSRTSEENCKKISEKTKEWWDKLDPAKQEKIIKGNLTHKGWKNGIVPKWVREKISNTLKNGKGCKKVKIVELDKEFNSINDCAKYLNTDCAYVSNHIHGRFKSVKGYHIVRCRD